MTEFNFSDQVDTPKEGVENREKREVLKDLITQGKKLPEATKRWKNYIPNILRKNFNTREKKLAKQWGNT